ncbi:IMPACT family protein [Cesiribacter andamanensis]|uniref:IMPACT family member yigZ n=1 Tax=Cesiribacter andamanensis AMV16 TaxID=1279009 RepID=M7N8H6_9BACT|nr:YigZ family protein [Cesiribacter andamanensis]EMR03567.1 IMPACT family member yigZ [Cesiribacter andamanensis AMV16]
MPAPDTYRTLTRPCEGLYKEKGSKFIARAYPVRSEEDIKQRLEELRKEYFDARHHCYAWILGPRAERYRANDGGEPNHSAGDPILGQIRSLELTNTLVVVIRYFGGTKLGVSGLIQAYKTAAAEALAASEVVEELITAPLTLHFGYEQTNEVMRLVSEYELQVVAQEFTDRCRLQLAIRQSRYAEVLEKATDLRGVQVMEEGRE